MPVKFANNASTTLASGITSAATSLTVAAGRGGWFPTLGVGDYFYCTLDNGTANEIIRVGARSGDVFSSILRAQEGTTALAFSAGATVELRVTAQGLTDLSGGTTVTGGSMAYGVSVKNAPYSAAGNGSTDDTAALNSALNSGAKTVWLPAGTYRVTSQITVPLGVSLIGEGSGCVTLDASAASPASFSNAAIVYTTRTTLTALPALNANITKGDRTITLASAPSVSPGDIIVIYNATAGSYNPTYTQHHAGEYCRVHKVIGSVVYITGTLCANYSTGTVTISKFASPAIGTELAGFTVKCMANRAAGEEIIGIEVNHCVDGNIHDLRVLGASYTAMELHNCYGMSVSHCTTMDDGYGDLYGGDYGFVVSNCHKVNIEACEFSGGRHGSAIGDYSGTGDIVNRYIKFDRCFLASQATDMFAADMHGNAEFCEYHNCVIDGGLVMGGNYNRAIDNTITAHDIWATYVAGNSGLNFEIRGNTITSRFQYAPTSRGVFLEAGGDLDTLVSTTPNGGTLVFADNILISEITADQSTYNPIMIGNWGYNGTQPIHIVIENNVLRQKNQNVSMGYVSIYCQSSARAFDSIIFKGNKFCGASGPYSSGGTGVARRFDMIDNVLEYGYAQGCQILDVTEHLNVRNNTFARMGLMGGWFGGSTYRTKHVHISGNSFDDNNRRRQSSSTNDTSFLVGTCDRAVVHDNVVESRNEYITVANNASFTIGELITGGTSGATARVRSKRSTTEIHIETSRTGTFTSETITGGTSGASTTVSATGFCNANFITYSDVTTAWTGGNAHLRSLANNGAPGTTNAI